MKGVDNAIKVARELEKKGQRLKGIRLDSGNLAQLARSARLRLNRAGLSYVRIFASGNLDEYKIHELIACKAPIDSFGVGTQMGVSADAPYCDVIYKLSEITDSTGKFLPTMKLSTGKVTYPGRKQVFRVVDKKGMYKKDMLGLQGERVAGEPLLVKIIDNGIVVYDPPSLGTTRDYALANLARLPAGVKRLNRTVTYPVVISPGLQKLTKRISAKILLRTRR